MKKLKLYMIIIYDDSDIADACFVIAKSKSKALSRLIRACESVLGAERWESLKSHNVVLQEMEEFLPPGRKW